MGPLVLIGRYVEGELRDQPVYTPSADGLPLALPEVEQNSIVRQMQVMKLRGQQSGALAGITFRITSMACIVSRAPRAQRRSSIVRAGAACRGIRELDALIWRRHPEGDSCWSCRTLRSGQNGARHSFIAEGLRHSEPLASVAMFEENPSEFHPGAARSVRFRHPVKDGSLKLIYLRPLTSRWMRRCMKIGTRSRRSAASAWLIDSLVGSRWRWPPAFRTDFRDRSTA